MRVLLALLLLATAAPDAARAGPWPRERGEIYWLLQQETGTDWSTLYAEWGGPLGLTFGLDAGGHAAAIARREPGLARWRSFARYPVGPAEGAWRFAVEGGVGTDLAVADEGIGTVPRVTLGLSVGRGLEWRGRGGWASADLRAEAARDLPLRLSGGAKLGWKPTDRDTFEISVDGERAGGARYWTVGPTYERRVGRVGLRLGLRYSEGGEARLRLGIAGEF